MTDIIRGYRIPLSAVDCRSRDTLTDDMLSLMARMSSVADKIVQDHGAFILDLIGSGVKAGAFRDLLHTESGFDIDRDIPGLSGGKSRYWRIISSHIFQCLSSRYESLACQRIITESGYTGISPGLYGELHSHGLYPTRGNLLNIFSYLNSGEARSYILPPAPLDYSYAGDRVVKDVSRDGRTVTCRIQVGTSQWRTVGFTLPGHIDPDSVTKVSKPAFYITRTGEVWMKYAVYTTPAATPATGSDSILGCDLGRIKPITCAAVSPDGTFTRELAPSKELDQLSGKLTRLGRNKESLFRKKNEIATLLSGNDDHELQSKWEKLDAEYHLARSKQSRIRQHLSRLCGRDVVNHTLAEGCSDIQLEHLSWVGSSGGKWNFSATQSAIEDVARHEGIRVKYVDAHGTSWEFPEEYEQNPAPKAEYDPHTRRLRNESGETVDKDYSAAIAIACRIDRKKALRTKKKVSTRSRAIQPKRSRDKNAPTPKRPRRRTRSGCLPRRVVAHNPAPKAKSHHLPVGVSMTVDTSVDACQVMSNNSYRTQADVRLCPIAVDGLKL